MRGIEVDHAGMETVPKLVSNNEETPSDKTTLEQEGNLPSGNPRKESPGTREGEDNFLDASQMPLKIPSELPYQRARKARQTVAKRNLEVPAPTQ